MQLLMKWYNFAVSLRQWFIEKMSTSKLIGILFKFFMKCREKRCPQWRASTARCLTAGGLQSEWRPQILYLVGVSSHPLVWLLITGTECISQCVPFLFSCKKPHGAWSFAGNAVHLRRRNIEKEIKTMKAYLYKEGAQPIEPIDEHKLAIAEDKPEKPDVPKLSLYVVKYKPLWTATFIALVIFVIWALATWLLN